MLSSALLVAGSLILSVSAQNSSDLTNSFPHDYPGKPDGDFSPEWQDYFFVKDALPNVTFPLSRSFAGNIAVNRTKHPNDTLFFWAFENQNGSLTAAEGERSDVPWAIWLNGGPGASSLFGLLGENGPLHVTDTGNLAANEFSWNNLVDYFWVDQPVGVGFSTADSSGYVADEDQMGEDFVGFLTNLVKIFPSLATRPLLLTGESYAGTYIPYIMKAIFSRENPPVNVVKVVIGDGAIGSITETQQLTTMAVLETYPQLIGYDTEVYEYFKEQTHLCGFDINITYPQTGGHFPSFNLNFTTKLPIIMNGSDSLSPSVKRRSYSPMLVRSMLDTLVSEEGTLAKRGPGRNSKLSGRASTDRSERREAWVKEKRDLSGRANGTIDPWYECFLSDELQDYALNFSLPWSLEPEVLDKVTYTFSPLNPYNLPDARSPEPNIDPTTFLNDNVTRAALHAPTSKNWSLLTNYPFNNTLDFAPDILSPSGDPSAPPSTFFSEFMTNATAANVSVVIYSGNDDSVIHHFSSEMVIQNTTFGGIQGFTKQPQTPLRDDDGNILGLVHQERGLTYVLIQRAGHEVPEFNPLGGFILLRDFIVGSNDTGLLLPNGTVVGGEAPELLQGDIVPGQASILFGSGSATSVYVAPSATIASWESFFSTAVAAETEAASFTPSSEIPTSIALSRSSASVTSTV